MKNESYFVLFWNSSELFVFESMVRLLTSNIKPHINFDIKIISQLLKNYKRLVRWDQTPECSQQIQTHCIPIVIIHMLWK